MKAVTHTASDKMKIINRGIVDQSQFQAADGARRLRQLCSSFYLVERTLLVFIAAADTCLIDGSTPTWHREQWNKCHCLNGRPEDNDQTFMSAVDRRTCFNRGELGWMKCDPAAPGPPSGHDPTFRWRLFRRDWASSTAVKRRKNIQRSRHWIRAAKETE